MLKSMVSGTFNSVKSAAEMFLPWGASHHCDQIGLKQNESFVDKAPPLCYSSLRFIHM